MANVKILIFTSSGTILTTSVVPSKNRGEFHAALPGCCSEIRKNLTATKSTLNFMKRVDIGIGARSFLDLFGLGDGFADCRLQRIFFHGFDPHQGPEIAGK